MLRSLLLSSLLAPASALAASGSLPAGTVTTNPCTSPATVGLKRLCECHSAAKAGDYEDLYTGVSGTLLNSYTSGNSCFDLEYSLNNATLKARNRYGTKFRNIMADAEAFLSADAYSFPGTVISDFGLRNSPGDLDTRKDEAFMSAEGGVDPSDGGGDIYLPPIGIILMAPGHWVLEDEFGNPTGDVFGDPSLELKVGYATDIGEDGILDFTLWFDGVGSYDLHSIEPGAVYDLGSAIPSP